MIAIAKNERRAACVRRVLSLVLLVGCAGLLPPELASAGAGASAAGQQRQRGSEPTRRLGYRLRSFVTGASGSIYFEPTPAGGNVRLTALGLPAPQELAPDANAYVVWAVAAGAPTYRVGLLQLDANGNGGLKFARPENFEQYSVIVTAEPDANPARPMGAMVLASRRGAVAAFFGEAQRDLNNSQLRRMKKEIKRSALVRRARASFFDEVDDALDAAGGGRVLELYGDEWAPEAHGVARATARDRKAYVRTLFSGLPLPASVGVKTYVLWSTTPDNRILYMGSLPTAAELNNADIYVRLGGVAVDDYDLFVTAEMRRPVARPSIRRALSTRTEEENTPAYGAVEGQVADSEGRPVAGAKVIAVPVAKGGAGALPGAYTDEAGRFLIDGVPPGVNLIMASKEEEGYASQLFSFFVVDANSVPQVNVSNQQVTQGVVVRLGPKAGRLTGQVVDAESGRAIQNAEIDFYRADNPALYYSTGPNRPEGRFEHLVPPVALRMKVSAPGYEDWHYGQDGAAKSEDVLELSPDAARELTIALRPKRGQPEEHHTRRVKYEPSP